MFSLGTRPVMALRKPTSLGSVFLNRVEVCGRRWPLRENDSRRRHGSTALGMRPYKCETPPLMEMTSSVLWGRVHTRLYSQHDASKRHKDWYSVMGVTPHATQEQIKEAYYGLSMKYHPDRNRGSAVAHDKFTELTEAYATLGNYEVRRKYDKGLLHKHRRPRHTHQEGAGTRVHGEKVKYNFDEFYRMHYGEALKREQQRMRQRKVTMETARQQTIVSDNMHQVLVVCVTVAVLLVGRALAKSRTTRP